LSPRAPLLVLAAAAASLAPSSVSGAGDGK